MTKTQSQITWEKIDILINNVKQLDSPVANDKIKPT